MLHKGNSGVKITKWKRISSIPQRKKIAFNKTQKRTATLKSKKCVIH